MKSLIRACLFTIGGGILIGIGILLTFPPIHFPRSRFPRSVTISLVPTGISQSMFPATLPSQMCTWTDIKGQQTLLYSKPHFIRIDFPNNTSTLHITNILVVNSLIYTWNSTTGQGVIYPVSQVSTDQHLKDIINSMLPLFLTQSKICQTLPSSNAVFSLPTSVTFTNSPGTK